MLIQLKGHIKDGKLIVDLPPDPPDGEIIVSLMNEFKPLPQDQWWTDAELDEMLRPNPQSGAEIAQAPEIGS